MQERDWNLLDPLEEREGKRFNETDRRSDRDQNNVKEDIQMNKMINLKGIWGEVMNCDDSGILQLLSADWLCDLQANA